MYEYENLRRVTFDCDDLIGIATYVPICPKCCRFVKADETIAVNLLGEMQKDTNANCSRCGRVEMPFEGFM